MSASMEDLTSNQVALIGIVCGLAGAFLGWVGRGLSFLIRRWWTGSPKHEHATYLNTVADLGAKLRAHAMTLEDVRQLEMAVQNPSLKSSETAMHLVEQLIDDLGDGEEFRSNAAMKARTGAAYEVAEATLKQALTDLRLLIGEHEWKCVEEAQGHWLEYRRSLEGWALREYEGGTGATLASALAGMAETERRAEEIRAQVEARAAHPS